MTIDPKLRELISAGVTKYSRDPDVFLANKRFSSLVNALSDHIEDDEDGWAIAQHILMDHGIFSDLTKHGEEEYARIEELVAAGRRR